MTRSNASASAGRSSPAFDRLRRVGDGEATATARTAPISAFQLAISEAGTTSRLGRASLRLLALQCEQQGDHLDGLAQAHVVGQAGAQPQPRHEAQPAAARPLVRPQLRPQVGRGRLAPASRAIASPLSDRFQLRAGGQARPFANRRLGCRPSSSPVERSRRPAAASPRRTTCPSWRTSRSTSFQCSRASASFSRSTSTHLPLSGTSPPLASSSSRDLARAERLAVEAHADREVAAAHRRRCRPRSSRRSSR